MSDLYRRARGAFLWFFLAHMILASLISAPLLPLHDLLAGRPLMGDGGVLLGDLLSREIKAVRSALMGSLLGVLTALVVLFVARFFLMKKVILRGGGFETRHPSFLSFLGLSALLSLAPLLMLALFGYGVFRETEFQDGALSPFGAFRMALYALTAGIAGLSLSLLLELGRVSLFFSPHGENPLRSRLRLLQEALRVHFLSLFFSRSARGVITLLASFAAAWALSKNTTPGGDWFLAALVLLSTGVTLLSEVIWIDYAARVLESKLPAKIMQSELDDRSAHGGEPTDPSQDPVS